MSGEPVIPEFNECILCGKCLEVCPVFRATNREELSPRGKAYLLQELTRGKLLDCARALELCVLCLSCGNCVRACPQGIDLPDILARVRAEYLGLRPLAEWFEDEAYLRPWLGAYRESADEPSAVERKLKGIGTSQALAKEPGLEPRVELQISGPCLSPGKVLFFNGCTANYARPDWSGKVLRILADLGLTPVTEPDWACCGFTFRMAGLAHEAARMREINIDIWRSAGRPRILTICAACRAGLSAYADDPGIFKPGEARRWRDSILPLAEFIDGVGTRVLPGARPIVYHKPCRANGHDPDLAWLKTRLKTGVIYRAVPGMCCGMGGVLHSQAGDLADKVAENCWDTLYVAGADVVSSCGDCLIRLAETRPEDIRVGHWLELIG